MHPDAAPLTPQQLAESPDVYHPVLRRHPDTGEEILYINLPDCRGIDGLPDERALAIVKSLFDRITDPAHVHRHKWAAGDLVIWDNRTLLHSATWFDAERYQRRMLRTCVRGEKPISSVSVAWQLSRTSALGTGCHFELRVAADDRNSRQRQL